MIGTGLALALAWAAARFYVPPSLNGGARQNPWLELDFCLASASSLLALGVAAYAGRAVKPSRSFARVLGGTLLWIALTIVLVFSWRSAIALSALLVAPSHALLGLRLAGLWRAWRSERLWRRRRG
jgi:hypothetical protein